jgi:hypothetical protein
VDQKAGTVRIPIERAMDLLVQRGLPTHPSELAKQTSSLQEPGGQKKKTKETTR